jgi:hypothetical protein
MRISDVMSIFSAGFIGNRTVKRDPSNQLGKEKSKTTPTLREVPLGLSQQFFCTPAFTADEP